MNIKLSRELIEKFQTAKDAYGFSKSVITRKAIRHYRTVQPVLSIKKQASTYKGECYDLDIDEVAGKLKAPKIRAIMNWYLDKNKPSGEPDPYFSVVKVKEVEGIDYNVRTTTYMFHGDWEPGDE